MNDTDRPFPIADDADYHKALAYQRPEPLLTVDDLIQTMRLKSLSEVRAGLEKMRKKQPAVFNTICQFYAGLK